MRVIGIDGLERNIPGVDGEHLTAEGQCNARVRGAWDSEATLVVGNRSGDAIVDCRRVISRDDHEGCSGVEDGSAAVQAEVSAINADCIKSAFPESLLVDVGDRDQGVGVEFGSIKCAVSKKERTEYIRIMNFSVLHEEVQLTRR